MIHDHACVCAYHAQVQQEKTLIDFGDDLPDPDSEEGKAKIQKYMAIYLRCKDDEPKKAREVDHVSRCVSLHL